MKRIFKTISAVALGLSLLTSCDRTDSLVVLEQQSKPMLEASAFPQTTFVITEDNKNETIGEITFSKSVFNPSISVNSQLEIALAGTNFANAVNLGQSTSKNVIKLSYAELNTALLQLGIASAKATELEVRLKSSITNIEGKLVSSDYSAPIKITATPFAEKPIDLYLIGSATPANWDNKADNINLLPLLKSEKIGEYTFIGFFKKGEFKIIKTKGDWSFNYGGENGKLSSDNGKNIEIESDGYYELSVNTKKLTYVIKKATVSNTQYQTVGIIGDATAKGWDASTPMKQSEFDPHLWILENAQLKVGEFKFRANNGADNWGGDTEFFGVGVKGGKNIKNTEAGAYHIYFNDATAHYTVIPVK